MLNWIFLILILAACITGAFAGTMEAVSDATAENAAKAVKLAIGLIGQMALWLGVMQVLQDAGLMKVISRALKPIMSRIFPEVPAEHPAMGAMILNIAANMMGLTNAATPFGLKAMIELNKLNKHQGIATNSMALFLAINTSGVAVMPLGVIAIRATMGSQNVAGIFVPSILSTMCSTIVAIIVAKLLERTRFFSVNRYLDKKPEAAAEKEEELIKGLDDAEEVAAVHKPFSIVRLIAAGVFFVIILYGFGYQASIALDDLSAFDTFKKMVSEWVLPMVMITILLLGFSKRVKVYESVVKGAKQGFEVGVMIIPFLVAILVCIGMFRASGAMDYVISGLTPITSLIGMPAEALPMALIRPLSGSGALGVLMETMKTYGPDSFTGFLVSVMSGSTETTFYVLAVYFGAVHVRATRHTVLACLAADLTGVLMALVFATLFFSAVA